MIRCVGSVREADGWYFVSVRGETGHVSPFYHSTEPPYWDGDARREFVNGWIESNCEHAAAPFGNGAVRFKNEGEAALFWLTFSNRPL